MHNGKILRHSHIQLLPSCLLLLNEEKAAFDLTSQAGASKAVQLLAPLLPLCMLQIEGKVASCQLLPLRNVVQGSENQFCIARLSCRGLCAEIVKPSHVRHAVMVYQASCGVDATASQSPFTLHCRTVSNLNAVPLL